MPERSFLLDPPKKPTLKRVPLSECDDVALTPFERKIAANPYASILATPVRQCLYTRLLLPNAFLTKFIQAAGPDDRPWIVPERILPYAITKKPTSHSYQDDPRKGLGKWVTSTSAIIDGVVKEGRYKFINPAAFMRPDMSKLVYAQWSIRVAHQFRVLFRESLTKPSKKRPSLRHPRLTLLDGSKTRPPGTKTRSGALEEGLGSTLGFRSAQNVELPCVLYFGKGLHLAFTADKQHQAAAEHTSKDQDRDLKEQALATSGAPSTDIDITKPSLPTFSKDNGPTHERLEILQSNGRRFMSPVYDMERLFEHHPQGLDVIKKTCLDLLPNAQIPSQLDSGSIWMGVRGSRETIPIAVGLWKMASL
ncbi:hypothetical protein BGX29_009438 [Mortierella sp. GBA35]|nr:hypothetical protein BGX29_009438 [Mortierella sp. GBA35]